MSRRPLLVAAAAGAIILFGIATYRTEGSAHGRVFPALVGDLSPHDKAVRQGLLLAQDALNAAPDATPVAVEFHDPAGSVDTALAHLRALEARKVDVVVDFTGAELLLGCAKHLRASPLVVLTSEPDPRFAATRCGERLLRVSEWRGGLARDVAEWTRDLGLDRIVLVVADSDEGRAAREAFSRALLDVAPAHVLELGDPAAQARWAADRVRAADPKAVVLLGAGWLPVVEALGQLDAATSMLIFTDDPRLGADMKESLARSLLPRLHLAEPVRVESSMRAAVDAAWASRFGEQAPAPEAVHVAWDALHVAARATRDQSHPEKVLLALRGTSFAGASGELRFQSDGERRPRPGRRRTYTAEGVVVPWVPDVGGAR